MSELPMRAAAWLLTYALHSTLLLGAAFVLSRRVRGEAWRETLWKAALFGGLVTATAQTLSSYEPPFGTWRLSSTVGIAVQVADDAPDAAAHPSPAIQSPAESAPNSPSTASTASVQPAGASRPATAPRSASTDPAESTASFSIRPLIGMGIGAWAAIALLMIVRICWRQGRLWRMLAGRREVKDGALLGMLAGLRRNAGLWRPVRLTACEATPTPLALGGGEVCVPPRFLVDLDPEQQRSALAHELAHLARRDPAWHFAVAVIEAVFFFQPLNRLARLRLRESAEFLCDEWAARQTGSPLGLARCLAEVASWVAPGRPAIPAGTMAMAEGGSPLVRRVQRLTTWRGGSHPGSGMTRAAGGVLLVLAVAVAAPAVASSGERRGGERREVERPVDEVMIREGTQERIIRHRDPSAPLADRWTWAVAEIGRRRLDHGWIAYAVPSVLRPGHTWVTDSDGFGIGELGSASVNHVVGAAEEDVVMIFGVAPDGEVERVAGRSAAGFDFAGVPVMWLGRADGDQSFAQLRRLADGLRDPDLRESLVETIGIHRGDAMVPYLAAVLGRDGSNGVRREAAQALGRHPGAEALAALTTAVDRDGSDDVRREAVEALGAMRHPDAVGVLRQIAEAGTRASIRLTALEALEDGGEEGLASLRRIAIGGEDQALSRQAVESMETYPAEQAVPLLTQIAWQPGRDLVARQAAESLGDFPLGRTLAALDSIARHHPSKPVAMQAVETLGGYRDPAAARYLSAYATSHRDPAVREEAQDQLRRRRERASEPATAPDGGEPTTGESDPDPDF